MAQITSFEDLNPENKGSYRHDLINKDHNQNIPFSNANAPIENDFISSKGGAENLPIDSKNRKTIKPASSSNWINSDIDQQKKTKNIQYKN